jgi:signal transduction histidine kinase
MTMAGPQAGRSERELAGAGGLTDEPTASSSSAPDAESMDSWVYRQRVEGTRDGIRQIVWANSVAGIVVGLLLWPTVPTGWLLSWLALHIGVGALRLLAVRRYDADPAKASRMPIWALRFAILSLAAGLTWSFPVARLVVADDLLRPVGEILLVSVPVIVLVSQRYFAGAIIAFASGFLLPTAGYLLLFAQSPAALSIGAMCLAYEALLVVAGLRAQAITVSLLVSRFQRDRFIGELQRTRNLANEAAHAKSEFLARVSHELRTPLTIVLGMAQLLKSSPLNEEQREGVDMIERSGEALLALISQLLDLSEVEAGRLTLESTVFDMRRTIDVVAKQLSGEASVKGLRFGVYVADSVPVRLRGDERRLRQVLRNLCENAIKFTASGRVDLSVSTDTMHGAKGLVTLKFSVSDTGIGMDKEVAAKAFEPFFQAESALSRKFGGTGLGLAVARELVRLMGGTIALQSEPGRGTTFTFTANFERIAEDEDHLARMVAEKIASSDKLPIRVLLVEDEPVNVVLASSLLRLLADNTDVAASGEEALRAVQGAHYDVILMDCVMPGMDGYETARKIRELEKRLGWRSRIIALTASTMPEDRDRCFAAGMDAFVSKPYKLAELRNALRQGVHGAA